MSRSWFGGWRKQKSRRSSRRGRLCRFHEAVLAVERLEDRTLLSVVTWINPSGGDWDTAANWSGGHVPSASDDVQIATTGITITHTLDINDSAHSLTSQAAVSLSAGSLALHADSQINDDFNVLNGGTLSLVALALTGSGTSTNAGNLDLYGATVNTTLDNQGTLIVQGQGNAISGTFANAAGALLSVQNQPNYNGYGSSLTVANGFTNQGTIELANFNPGTNVPDDTLTVSTGTLTNAPGGVINILDGTNAAGSRTLTASLDNQGTLHVAHSPNVAGAGLNFRGTTLTTSGTLTVDPGSSLEIDGGLFNPGGSISGVVQVKAGALGTGVIPGSATVYLVGVHGGPADAQLVNEGTLIVQGQGNAISGTFANAAGALLSVQNQPNYNGYGSSLTVANGFTNQGTIELANFNPGTNVPDDTLTVSTGTLTNAQGGVINSLDGTNANGARIFDAQIDNQGTVRVGHSLVINKALNNTGTITVTQAVTISGSGSIANSGIFDVESGTSQLEVAAVSSVNGRFAVSQGAALDLTGGRRVSYTGTLIGLGAGTVTLSGGTLAIGLGGVTLNFPGSMLQWTGGNFDSLLGDLANTGTINLLGPNDKTIDYASSLNNLGAIFQSGRGNLVLASGGNLATTLNNAAGATYEIADDSGLTLFHGHDSVINGGIIKKTGGSGTSPLLVDGQLSNSGTIEADSGTLYLEANAVTQVSGNRLIAGTWNALNGATLKFPTSTVITSSAANLALGGTGATITALAGPNFTNSGSLTVGAGSTFNLPGTFAQTSTGALNIQIGGTPVSGQFGQIQATGAATLAGAFNVSLVNGFSPSLGQDYAVLAFASATGSFTTFTGLDRLFTESLGATSLNLHVAMNAVNLVATSVAAPTAATAGQPIPVTWTVANSSSLAATGNWVDSVYLSATPTITSSSTLLGTVEHSGGLGAGMAYQGSLTTALPPAPGDFYVLVQADSHFQVPVSIRDNTTRAAPAQLHIGLPVLTPGTSYRDAFTAADQDHYYQVAVSAGGALVVTLQSDAASGATALYLSQGTLPTAYNYQQAAAVANQPNQTLTVPQAQLGTTYYILAHSVSGSAATAGFILTATQSNALTVSAISSYPGGNAGNVTIEIDGTNFTPAVTASLTLGATTIDAAAIDFETGSQIYATFNLSGAAPGNYTLSVQQGSQSAQAPVPFQVVAANPASLNVVIITPQYIRAGRPSTFVVTYTNPTANDMVAPLLDITSSNTKVFFSAPDDPNDFTQSAQVLGVAPSGPAGILRPGQSGQFTLIMLGNDTVPGDLAPVQVKQIKRGQPIDWSSQKGILRPSSIPAAAWNVIFNNVLGMVGTTTDSYNAALAQAATYLGDLGEPAVQASNVTRLWSFLVAQASAFFPTSTLTSAVDASLSSPGNLSLAVERTFRSSIAGRYTPGIFGLGWTTSWEASLSFDSSGNATLDLGGVFGYFVRQINGSYLDTAGEYGTLIYADGVYTFTDTAGTQYVFLPSGRLNYVQDANHNRITAGYNAQNQLITLTYSNPGDPSEPAEQLTLTYNAQGQVHQVADGTGDTWTYAYDSTRHLRSVTGPGNLTTSYTYDTGTNPETVNALLSITYIDGSRRNFTYGGQGRLIGTSQNNGANPITYAYLGEAEVSATDAAHNQTTVWFNDLGLPSRVQDPRGAMKSYLYDTNGNLVRYTDAAGNTYQYAYDGNGNRTQIVNPLGQTVQATYGPLSNLTSITDAAGHKTQYGYDAAGNLLSIAYPGGSRQSFTYDPLGNLSESTLQNGDPVGYQYNALGLVTQETFADGTSQTFDYDAHGNLLTAKTLDAGGALTGTTALTYNAVNELTSITYPNGQYLHFTYNPMTGQRTQSVDQDGFTVNYMYDALGRLYQLKDGAGSLIVQYTYNNLGQLQQKQNGNGTYTTYGYDAAGNVTSLVNYAGGTTVNSSFTYTYNLLGEQTSMTDAAGTTMYTYDAIGQLTQVNLPGGGIITYRYDAAGNRTEVISNGMTTSYASNADNEITQVGSAIYTYDADGNLHTVTDASGTTTYTYNDLNQLVSIKAPDGTTTTFQYSPLGYLVGTSVNSTATNYLVDPTGLGNVAASYSSQTAHYTYGLGLVSQAGPSGTSFYDFDASGNTVGITGSGGTYVNQYSYLPFGETTTVSATLPNAFTFAGQVGAMQIGASLFHMRARDYAPATGQFLSNDPLGLVGGDTNLRRIVNNSPPGHVDPSGKSWEWLFIWLMKLHLDFPPETPPPPPPTGNPPISAPPPDKGGGDGKGNDDGKKGDDGNANKSVNPPPPGPPPSPPPPCFPPDTLVATETGLRPIGQVEAGERVWSYDFQAGAWRLCEVECRHDSAYDGSLVTLDLGGSEVTATANHPFWVIEGENLESRPVPQHVNLSANRGGSLPGRWADADDLRDGDTVFLRSVGPAAVRRITISHARTQVCNLTVRELHTYAVGKMQVLVHNKISLPPIHVPPLPPWDPPGWEWPFGPYFGNPADPNALFGPSGYGPQGFIRSSGTWSYTAEFENDGSAAAQDVTVTEQFNANLDWSTFQLGSFGFGPVKVTIPAGLTKYQTTVAYQNVDGSPLNVQVSLDFNVQSGLLSVTFISLDPATGQAPDGVFDGFLPPDDSSGIGEGFVQYTVQPKAGLTTGTIINAQAAVVFDINDPLDTPTVVNTIDARPPTSSVHPLPADSPPTFPVTWSGADDPGGSGVAYFDVYVSDDGGPFTLWLGQTTHTRGMFTGVFGHSYGFYSVATDNVGNREAAPSMAQATTVVNVAAMPTHIQIVPAGNAYIAGTPFTITVRILDNGGNVVPGYTGTITFGSSDPQASLPPNYTFTAADAGVHTFTVTLFTAGPQTLIAGDALDNLTGQAAVINEFATPTANSGPSGITFGPDGNVWFVEVNTGKIGRITPDGTITEFTLPSSGSRPLGITAGPDGNLWFTEFGLNRIGMISPDGGVIREFTLPMANSGPEGIVAGPDGNLWFTEYTAGQIGMISPDGSTILEFALPTPNGGPLGIAVGLDGNLWFTEFLAGQIGMISPDGGTLNEFALPTPNSGPMGIAAGLDGNLWFTEFNANQVGSISPDGSTIIEWPVPTAQGGPEGIVTAPNGNLWFTEANGNQIGQITASGGSVAEFNEFSVSTSGIWPVGITADGSGNLWFTESQAGTVGELIPVLTITAAPADHFVIFAPARVVAGMPFDITVMAVDPYGNIDTDYRGTIHFTSTDADPGVVLPADYTFQPGDAGMVTFAGGVTLITPGDQGVTVSDVDTGPLTGSATITVTGGAGPVSGRGGRIGGRASLVVGLPSWALIPQTSEGPGLSAARVEDSQADGGRFLAGPGAGGFPIGAEKSEDDSHPALLPRSAAAPAVEFQDADWSDVFTAALDGLPYFRLLHGNATGVQPADLFQVIPSDLKGGITVGG